jgi:uncharacterized protein YeaO (DUF488 family)
VLRRRSATLEELRYEDGRRTYFVPEAGKAEDLRKIGGRAAERNVTLLFGAKDAEHNNARALVAFLCKLGGAA